MNRLSPKLGQHLRTATKKRRWERKEDSTMCSASTSSGACSQRWALKTAKFDFFAKDVRHSDSVGVVCRAQELSSSFSLDKTTVPLNDTQFYTSKFLTSERSEIYQEFATSKQSIMYLCLENRQRTSWNQLLMWNENSETSTVSWPRSTMVMKHRIFL